MNPSRVSYNRGMNEKGLGQDEKRGFSSCTLITSGPSPPHPNISLRNRQQAVYSLIININMNINLYM